jgi:broad specificity phosphatase PhoE
MNRKYVLSGAWIALALGCLASEVQAQRLIFVARHAERADGGAAKMQMQADPALSAAGEIRAGKLAAMLKDAGIQAVYATEFRRTQDTAKPLAARLGLEIRTVPSKDTVALLEKLRAEHAREIVLVVGHSNTVPPIIKALCGAEVTLADNEYDNLFLVVPETRLVTRIRY